MIRKINQILHPSNLLVSYWAMFWLMNGLDKFFNRTSFALFTWHGKDRTEQFSGYFSSSDLPVYLIQPLLYFVGACQIILFFILAIAIFGKTIRPYVSAECLKLGLSFSALIFIAFSFFDVIFGDRAELLEHATFLVLIVVTYIFLVDNKELRFFNNLNV